MRKLTLVTAVALLAGATAIQAQGKGQGGGSHGQHGAAGQGGKSQGRGPVDQHRGGAEARGKPQADHGKPARSDAQPPRGKQGRVESQQQGNAKGGDHPARAAHADRSVEHKPRPAQSKSRHAEPSKARFGDRIGPGSPPNRDWRNGDFRMRTIDHGRYVWHEPVFHGCPPGLAKKGNGCLPPGQARKLAAFDHGYPRWYGYSDWYRVGPAYDWRYYGGYVYRVDPVTALVRSIVPLLGGALFGGNPWPQGYVVQELPPYHARYYGYDDAYRYRYADGVVYAIDPQTEVIQSVVALMTGQRWVVGSAMPPGYSFYNVPHEYRDQYVDTPSSWYRYDDGYVYEVDPTTLLVRRTIELLVT